MTEIFRAGIQSVSGGQGEAADALGMSYGQRMRKVVLPQALRVIIPPTGNEFIAMMKDTALVSFLGVTLASSEIFRRGQLVGKADFKALEALLVVAGMYWILTVIFTLLPGQARGPARQGLRASAGQLRRRGPLMTSTQGTAEPVVRCRNIHKRFGDLEVLRGIDLDLHQGEVLVIFGRSGSGKSTLLRCVNFLEDPTEGTIEVGGIDAVRGTPHQAPARPDPTAAAAGRHGLPAVQPVPAHDGAAEPDGRPAAGQGDGQGASCGSGASPSWTRWVWRTRPTSTRSGSPVVSSSGSRSPGRWRCSRR